MRWTVPSLICAAAFAAGCEAPEVEGNGVLAEDVRTSEPFTRLVVSDGIDVKVTVDPKVGDELEADPTRYIQVAVRTDENLLEHVDVYVYGDELIVETRKDVVPTAGIGSNVGYFVMFLGLVMQSQNMVLLGAVLFSAVLLFQIVTLPVEFDASARAKKLAWEYGLVGNSEREGVAKVLNAAALTYVAAAVSTLMTLLYFLLRAGLLGGNRD